MKKGCLIALAIFGGLIVLLIVGLGVLGFVGYKATQTPEFKKSFNDSFKTSYKASFMGSCAKDQKPEVQERCACMVDYLLENNSTSDLTALGMKTSEEIQKSEIMTKAVKNCVKTR